MPFFPLGWFDEVVVIPENRPVLYSRPYFDFSGAGEILTIGQPILDGKGQVFGAVGIDTAMLTRGIRTTTNLNLGIFDGRFESYLFIFDLEGVVIYHPFKPLDLNRPIMYYDVEKAPISALIQTSLNSVQNKTNEIVSHRVENHVFPVKANYDETNRVTYVTYNATYIWRKSDDFLIGILIFDHESSTILQKLNIAPEVPDSCKKFHYHSNIDGELRRNEWVRLNDHVINYNRVMTMFGVQAYQIERIIDRPESAADIKAVRHCLADPDDCYFEPLTKSAFDDLCAMATFDELWKTHVERLDQSDASLFSTVYGASASGIFKIYPGFNMSYQYEPSIRPWFIKAASSDQLEATTYIDHIWDIPIVTLSRSIKINSELRFVLAMDFNANLLQQLVHQKAAVCAQDHIECSLVDQNGVFIVHEEMHSPIRNFTNTNNLFYQEHEIYNDLDENGKLLHGSCHNLGDPEKLPDSIQINLTSYTATLDCITFTIERLLYFDSFEGSKS